MSISKAPSDTASTRSQTDGGTCPIPDANQTTLNTYYPIFGAKPSEKAKRATASVILQVCTLRVVALAMSIVLGPIITGRVGCKSSLYDARPQAHAAKQRNPPPSPPTINTYHVAAHRKLLDDAARLRVVHPSVQRP